MSPASETPETAHENAAQRIRRGLLPRSALALAMVVFLTDGARAASEVRSLEAEAEVTGVRVVYVDLSIGSLTVETDPSDRIEVRAAIECSRFSRRCRRLAERLTLETRVRGKALEVIVGGYPKASFGGGPKVDLSVRMPASLDLEADLGVGDVDVRGVEGDIEVDVGVGDAEIVVGERTVREVSLDVGVGSVDIDPRPAAGERNGFLFLGNEMQWAGGMGRADIEVQIGVGAARVRLEP